MDWTMDRCYSPLLLRSQRERGFSLVAALLLGAGMLLIACQPSHPPPPEASVLPDYSASGPLPREACQPMLVQIPDQPAEVQAGSWKYRFNLLLAGCAADLNSVSSTQKDEIVQLAAEEIRRSGLDITAQFSTPALGSRLLAAVNKRLGAETVSDV